MIKWVGVIKAILVKAVINGSTLNENINYFNEHDEKLEYLSEQVAKEDVVISNAHAVVYPRAVVIVSFDAPLAYYAVSASTCPNDLALWTKTLSVEGLKETQELDSFVRNIAWISGAQTNVQKNSQEVKCEGDYHQNWIESAQ